MYSTCLYCNAKLGTNDMLERFPVGRRLAFDASKYRLWIVCGQCRRWNLSPLEERFEAIEDCERLYRSTYARVSTSNIGLTKLRDGTVLVRVGTPLRPEFAAWRYAGELFSRRTRAYARVGATVAGAAGVSIGAGAVIGPAATAVTGAFSVVAAPVLAMSMIATTALGGAMADDYYRFERILGRFRVGRKRVIRVRAKHAQSITLGFHRSDEATIGLEHDRGWETLHGQRAMHATTVLLASTNQGGGNQRTVQSAVDQIEHAGNSARYLTSASKRNGWRGGRSVSVLNRIRGHGAMNLSVTERLALEMAMHEEIERRAAEGELAELHTAWIEAEEIASIVDNMLTPFN
jgi:hypothetical protein